MSDIPEDNIRATKHAPVHELLERIEHDAKMLERVCQQRDEAQRECAEISRKYTALLLATSGSEWTCAARKQGTAGGNDPADCGWPMCGCDPHADKVLAALQEQLGVL